MATLGQRLSPYLQQKLALLGVDDIFANVPPIVESLLGVGVSSTSVFRACQAVSDQLQDSEFAQPSIELARRYQQTQETIYAMVDGSYVPTRKGWQETKLGRVFGAYAYSDWLTRELKWDISESTYTAHRGHFEALLPPQRPAQKVFITDGAGWIGGWIAQAYPGAVHILDLYHVLEKVAVIAQDAPDCQAWFAAQKQALLASRLDAVLQAIDGVDCPDKVQQAQLRGYLSTHRHQMDYQFYRSQGWMVGSGPIESAHRTVLQVRMKRSGL